jgi:hypothetical protein
MRCQLRTLLILLSGAWLLMGCGQKSPPPAPKPAPASYALEVRIENGSSQASTISDNSEATVGAFSVKIQDGQITVNKRSYGKLNAGDKVLIQSDGQVLVNFVVREPWDKQER